MSMAVIENRIVGFLRVSLSNPKITKNWIQEWSTSKEGVEKNMVEGETLHEVKELGVYVALKEPVKKAKKS